MNDSDRAIVAAAEERDRKSLIRCRFTYVAVDGRPWECGYTQTDEYAHHGHEFTLPEGAAADRRELLRIVREQEFDAERYRAALEICAAAETPADAASFAIEINRRNIARHALRAGDAADDAAAGRATAGKWST